MSGALQLMGVECRCRVGVPEAERRRRQRVVLELTASVDLDRAARSDDPAESPDYQGLERAVRAAVEKGPFRLLERLAEAAADAALSFDARIRSVAVGAMKRPAAMPRTREVWVRLSRARP